VERPKATVPNFPSRELVEAGNAATLDRKVREPVVLYLGGMERNRGSELLVEAFHQVHDAMPEARLLVVGHFMPAELEKEVRSNAERRGFGQAVTLTGRVPFEQIGKYLAQAAVGWVTWQPVPKNQKNVPTKLFEYMAYGLPVVCSDLDSSQPYVADGETGYLVAADDADAHARRILELFRAPEAAAAMGTRGQTVVRTRFVWEVAEEELLALYQRLLS
jgi:glycosyltransferase involved in cell wall biosynthesis